MRKFIALLLTLALLTGAAFAEETAPAENAPAEEPVVLGENEILMHGYISPYNDYYIGVPAEWYILGAGSLNENLSEASEALEDVNVYSLVKQFDKENDVLVCLNADSTAGLVLTYGPSSGVTNDRMIDSLGEIESAIKAACPGVTFKDESGSFDFKSVAAILMISMNYKNRDILQYYVVSGSQMYIFTFFGTTRTIAETVLTTFTIQ